MSDSVDPRPVPEASGAWVSPFLPWLPERVLAAEQGLLVVDKPSGIPTHGGGVCGDVIGRLSAWRTSRGEPDYLGVHQRLDLGTSGVLAFVTDAELNAQIAAEFAEGRVRKRYLAVIEPRRGSVFASNERVELVHRLEADGKLQRVARRGGKECRARARVLRRQGARALVELLAETGRTHQLRVQLAAEGAPIAGDRDYDGARAPRLLLHAESLELTGLQRRFTAPTPGCFERWLTGAEPALGNATELRRKLQDAAVRRAPLLNATDVVRWVNGVGDELPGLEIDWYRGYVTLSVSSDEANARASEIGAALHDLGARGVYLKQRARADLRQLAAAELAPPAPIAGAAAPTPCIVSEGALRIEVELGDGLSTGLFLDQRDNRQRVLGTCRGARVLNLFSYTCSFSVAAALGGAARVTSVDVSKRALRRGEENFRHSGVDPTPHAFVQEDVLDYLERCVQRGERFDWVVLDPPSFSSSGGKNKVLRVERDYQRLATLALRVLAPQGRLLAVTNHRGTSEAGLRAQLKAAAEAAGKTVTQIKSLHPGADCPDGLDGPYPSKAALLTLS